MPISLKRLSINSPEVFTTKRIEPEQPKMSPAQAKSEDVSSDETSCKRVTFNTKVRAIFVLHLNNFTDEEVDAAYYTREDLQKFKNDVKLVGKLIEVGDLPCDTEDYCRRGAEFRTYEGAQRRIRNKESALDAVLDEQEAQWDAGNSDPDAIAAVYMQSSRHCLAEAQLIAAQDEKDAHCPIMRAKVALRTYEKYETAHAAPLKVVTQVRRRSLYSAAA